MRIRYFPRSQKFKFMFNKKIKISRLNYTKNSFSKNGQYNVKFTENCQLQYFQLKGLYHALLPYLKKGQLKLWIFGNFIKPLTSKPSVRMGTGKGKFKYFISHYKKGEIFLEFENIINYRFKIVFFKALRAKLPVHTIIQKSIYCCQHI